MGRTSNVVSVVDGVRVFETKVYDAMGNRRETYYSVCGERYETIQDATSAAGKPQKRSFQKAENHILREDPLRRPEDKYR